MNHIASSRRTSTTAAVAVACFVTTLSVAAGPASAGAAGAGSVAAPPSRAVPVAEQATVRSLDHDAIARIAKPLPVPAPHPRSGGSQQPVSAVDGPPVSVSGAAATSEGPAGTAATTATVTGILWPGAWNANPNRQVGKLYFDTDPGPAYNWSHCTATAINSENKSLVLTAGHCVFNTATRSWYTNVWFYPGYENGKNLGAWPARQLATTNNYYASGAFADDMAVVLVNRDSAGVPLVSRVGGHGIAFNQPVNQVRTSFGYPLTDSRWPGFTASGEDLYYCQGTDNYVSTGTQAGQMWLSCRMTGGASGGPWLTNVASNWMGTANSVNSNKGGIGSAWAGYMFGPYFGSAESNVFQYWRTR